MASYNCRACGKVSENMLNTFIMNIVHGELTYKKLIEKVLGTKLAEAPNDSRKICDLCVKQLDLLSVLANIWRKNELAITSGNEHKPEESQQVDNNTPKKGLKRSLSIKSEPGEIGFFRYEKSENGNRKSKSFTSLTNVKELFAKELAFKDILMDLENFSHIRVELSSLAKDGEISCEYLQKLGETKLWDRFMYFCDHCNTEIQGLLPFIDHKKAAGINSFKIKCIETNCQREFAALYSYINHCSTDHHEYLAFSCIFCSPTRIYYNMPCLLEHYISQHLDYSFTFYMCLECGTYCQSITQLRMHKLTMHDKVLSVSEDEATDSDHESARKQPKLSDVEWTPLNASHSKSMMNLVARKTMLNISDDSFGSSGMESIKERLEQTHPGMRFHPKVRNVGNRKTFPCPYEGCNRVLITQNGYDYHILTHTGEKPFKCRFCAARFRSKACCDNHEAEKHGLAI